MPVNPNTFPYHLDFKTTDFRTHPALYKIGVGEQGVLLVEPYKSEILPFWKFKDQALANTSSKKIFELFQNYLLNDDFIGADMARKFLQMGFTRARRYANHKGGKKYQKGNIDHSEGLAYPYSQGSSDKGNAQLPQQTDALFNEKAQVAQIFKQYWFKAKDDPDYLKMKAAFKEKYYSKTDSVMKSEEEINADIRKVTDTIRDTYPELLKYISEMPITNPDENNPAINTKKLEDYYDSLKEILAKYAPTHANQT